MMTATRRSCSSVGGWSGFTRSHDSSIVSRFRPTAAQRRTGHDDGVSLITGSTGRSYLESQAMTGGRTPPGEWVPTGMWHAVQPGTDTAICGADDVAHLWPDQPWGGGMWSGKCRDCDRIAAEA